MAKLLIFGTGEIARLAHYYFTHDTQHEVVGFAVDEAYLQGDRFLGLPASGFGEVTRRYPPGDFVMFIALSYARMNRVRAEKYQHAKRLGYSLVSYVSSRCTFLADEPVGENCFILEDNTIQPFVRIGSNVTLWSGNHIGHDSVIEDHCFITSHVVVSGSVRVGAYCFLGVNSTLRNSISLGQATLVGAGATVLHDTKENSVYLGPRAERSGKSSAEIDL